ncbi:unnamed protein product [Prunus brigantina]
MRSVNTPATLTTRLSTCRLLLRHVRPQHNITYHPSYDGTHPASYEVCQYAGYSYDTCDLSSGPGYILISPHTIISPLIRLDAPSHIWSLSTRRLLLRHVRPQLRTWLHSHQPAHNHLPSYVETHPATYGVCQHASYSYDTCNLTSISQYPLWAWLHSHQPTRVGPIVVGLNLQHAGRDISPHTSGRTRPRMGSVNTMLTLPRKSHGQPRVKLPNLGQTGPQGPRPPNSDPKVPIDSTGPRTHVLQVCPTLVNPENTQYAISVRDPNATVPMRRHSRWQRVGVQSDIASPENFQI